ncbi:hypothetical protein C4564_00635 [Candidatus Microgenomates bacterium]|nr:MAG: hypothetical protein C4564_00635 [Candidatus Microgenomates bacterium]
MNVFTAFHCNLHYSSLPPEYLPNAIKYSYEPIIKLLEINKKLKFGIEMPATTLRTLAMLNPTLLTEILLHIKNGRVEFIGSGYEQIVAPVTPHRVNRANLRQGNALYKKMLGKIPDIVYVNEQAYADSLMKLYKQFGYKAAIFDLESLPQKLLTNPQIYNYCPLGGTEKNSAIHTLWNSSVYFQKMQKYLRADITLAEYIQFLKQQNKVKAYSCIYGGDTENIGFKPYGLGGFIRPQQYKDIFDRLANALDKITSLKLVTFRLPSEILKLYASNNFYHFCQVDQPVLVKKQEKYNISRWSLAGRSNVFLNTYADNELSKNISEKNVHLWSSDYRTFSSNHRLYSFFSHIKSPQKKVKPKTLDLFSDFKKVRQNRFKTPFVEILLDPKKGGSIQKLLFPKVSSKSLIGTLKQGFYKEKHLAADWFSNHAITFTSDDVKLTDLIPAPIFTNETNKTKECLIGTSLGTHEVWKLIKLSKETASVQLHYYYFFHDLEPKSFRCPIFTLIPKSWDTRTIYVGSHFGTKELVTYKLFPYTINQDELVSPNVTSHGCLGVTENKLVIGDIDKRLVFTFNQHGLLPKPLIHFEPTENNDFYFRLYLSIAESDETSHHFFRGFLHYSLSISASKN